MANSFVFYESFRDATRNLPANERLALYESIIDYALYGDEPQGLGGVLDVAFKLIRPQIDANSQRRSNGKKGGRKPSDDKKPLVSNRETNGSIAEEPAVTIEEIHRLGGKEPMVIKKETNGFTSKNHRLEKNKPNVNVNGNVNVNVNGNGEDSAPARDPYDPEVKETFSLLTSESSELFPSQVTRESVLQWCDDVGHDLVRATIHQVFSENVKDKKPWKYIEKRLIDYHGRGIRTQEEVTAYETSRKNNRKAAPSIPTYEPDEMDFDAVMERVGVTG